MVTEAHYKSHYKCYMVTSGKKKKKSSTLQGFHMFSDMQCSLRLKQTLNSFHLWCGLLRQRIQQWASAKSTSLRASEKGSLRLIPCAIERSSIAVFWDVNSILLCGCELSQRTRYTTEKMQAIYIYNLILHDFCYLVYNQKGLFTFFRSPMF